MTWLGLVTTVTLVLGLLGTSILAMLGTSLRTQHHTTTKQSWNRRMLTAGLSTLAAALVVPFLLQESQAGVVFVLGWVGLGILVAAMFSARRPTRLLSVLLFLTLALAALVSIPPHRAAFYGVSLFVVCGLLLAKVTRSSIDRTNGRPGDGRPGDGRPGDGKGQRRRIRPGDEGNDFDWA
jgi:hypothetical protein